jgi:hypothetical protein
LADDGLEDPIEQLRDALKKNGVPEERFLVLKEGIAKDF